MSGRWRLSCGDVNVPCQPTSVDVSSSVAIDGTAQLDGFDERG
jgi:hypothetical protein